MKLRRMINLVLALLLLLLLIGAAVFYATLSRQVEARSAGHLQTMLMLRQSALKGHFESLRSEIMLWSGHENLSTLMQDLERTFEEQGEHAAEDLRRIYIDENPYAEWERARYTNSSGTSPYELLHASLHPRAKRFAEHHLYYDVFLVNRQGDVVYSMTKEDDFATNLVNGPFADTGLGQAFQRSINAGSPDLVDFVGFSPYAPSDGAPAAFISSQIHRDGDVLGVFIVQIEASKINAIMQFSAAMGETGETYLVGSDRLMHSDSRFFTESSVLKIKVETDSVERALSGESGVQLINDYRGEPVLSAYQLFNFDDSRWAIIAEQDVEEVQAPLRRAMRLLFIGYLSCLLAVILIRSFLLRIVLPHKSFVLLGLGLVFDEEALD